MRQSVNLPDAVAIVIFRCIEKEPSRRFASVAELRHALIFGGDGGRGYRPPLHRTLVAASIATLLMLVLFAAMLRNAQPQRTAAPIAPLAVVPPPLLPENPNPELQSIAVFPFQNLQEDPKYKSFERSIPENVMRSFSRSGRFRVVERSRLDELIGSLRAESPQKVGTMVGAQFLMFGSFQVFMREIQIYAEIVSTKSGVAVFTDMITGDVDSALALSDRFSEGLISQLKAVKK